MFGLLMPKGVFNYSVMPGVGPRLHSLFMGGFHYIPFFIAVVYQMVGLIPRNHPYLKQKNVGLYGVRHVIFEASRNIRFTLKNIDQIILFFAVLVGVVIFLLQILSLGAAIFLQPAVAAVAMPTNWTGFFYISNATYRSQDLAFMMLDMVFGVPYPGAGLGPMGFFESCIGSTTICQDNFGNIANTNTTLVPAVAGVAGQFGPLTTTAYTYFPFPYHLGMHRLFSVYSNGLLVIAVIITSYFIATILAETAQSGTPFGKRFNKTWAPLRIVIAFGLLIPLTVGLNSSQYLVLYAAKTGSAFASNGWRLFNSTLTTSYLGDAANLVTVPNIPEMGHISHFMYVAKVCKVVYEFNALKELKAANQNKNPVVAGPAALTSAQDVRMYALVREHSAGAASSWEVPSGGTYNTLLGLIPGSTLSEPTPENITIRFGVKDPIKYASSKNNVGPVCGELQFTLTDPRPTGTAELGPYQIQQAYFKVLVDLWHTGTGITTGASGGACCGTGETAAANHRHQEVAIRLTKGLDPNPTHATKLDPVYVKDINNKVDVYIDGQIRVTAPGSQGASTRYTDLVSATPVLYSKGWAAGGIWYNRVAEMNGAMISATYATPLITRFPEIMEKVSALKAKYDKDVNEDKKYEPRIAHGDLAKLLDDTAGADFAATLYTASTDWKSGGLRKSELTGNAFLDAIQGLLGLDGLYDMRRNPNAHPLAMLVGIGRSLVESAIRNMGYATMASLLGASPVGGNIASISASFFVSVAMMGLTVGFVLFYVVPFLPFIYFFFAVGGWIKGIFEAMVGAPLWALAHIRIDGHGLPGNAAINGYFLILEVFLRPILIIFGLLASISIFSALVEVLNLTFQVVTQNLAGYDMAQEVSGGAAASTAKYMRSKIDEFFFTVIYAIIVYLIGMSSFKLIDNIPNNILRWMGQSVATFGDQREDPAQGLVSKASIGSQQALSKIGSGLHAAVKVPSAVAK